MNFEDCLKTCYEDIVRYSWALAGSKSEGDDLLQDGLIRAWKAFPRLRNHDLFKSWLITIIRNTHRSKKKIKWLKRFVSLEAATDSSVEIDMYNDDHEVIRMALGYIPAAQREALILFEVLNMSVSEVARQQNVSISAAKSRLARGRKKLRSVYENLSNLEFDYETETA